MLQAVLANEAKCEAMEALMAKSEADMAKNVDEVRKVFRSFATDNSGAIDADELREAMAALGQEPSEEELMLLIEEADEDGSGEIEFEEFLPLIKSLGDWIRQMNAKKAHLQMLKDFPESHLAVEFNAKREMAKRQARIDALTKRLVRYRGWHKVIKGAITAESGSNLLVKDVVSRGDDPFARKIRIPDPKNEGGEIEVRNPWQRKRVEFSTCCMS